MNRHVWAAAFRVTVPVLIGYLAIGIAFGLMLEAIGYNFIWSFFMSLTIYAGSGQYLGVSLLQLGAGAVRGGADDAAAEFPPYCIRPVHVGKISDDPRPAQILSDFALTDETYALLSSVRVPSA